MKKLTIIALLIVASICSHGQYTEMLRNNNFSSTDYWSYDLYWSISDDTARFSGEGVAREFTQSDADMILSIEPNTIYTFTADITADSGERARFSIVSPSNSALYIGKRSLDAGNYVEQFTTPSDIGAGGFRIIGYADSDPFKLDSVSLVKNMDIGDSPYFVSLEGDDRASGDIDNPWATWAKAGRSAYAGDTVYFRGGTYYFEESVSLNGGRGSSDATMNNGEYGNPVCYFGYPPDVANGDSIIFDFSNNYVPEPDYDYIDSVYFAGGSFTEGVSNYGLSVTWANYFELKDFTVRNVYQKYRYALGHGIMLTGSANYTIERVRIRNIGGEGIFSSALFAGEPDTSFFINVDVINCIDSLSSNPVNYWEYEQAGSRSHGFFTIVDAIDSVGTSSVVTMQGCRAWYCGDDGFNVVVLGELIMDNCWSFSNGAYLDHMPNPGTSGNGYKLNAWAGAHNEHAAHSKVQYYVRNSIAAFNQGYGFSDNCPGTAPRKNRKMYNNLSVNNEGSGYVVKEGSLAWNYWYEDYINNIAYNNNPGYDLLGESLMTINLTNSWTDPPNVTVSESSFLAYPTDSAHCIEILGAPRKADGSLPDIGDYFKLDPSSGLVDAGTDVGMSTTPDIGIDWEYFDAGSPPVDPPVPPQSAIYRHLGSGGKVYYFNGKYLKN